jgi:excisionase family DNA binding protein
VWPLLSLAFIPEKNFGTGLRLTGGFGRSEGASTMPTPDLLTLTQVAERLQVSRWSIYQLIWAGDLPSVHIGRCHRIRAKDLETYIEALGAQATQQ